VPGGNARQNSSIQRMLTGSFTVERNRFEQVKWHWNRLRGNTGLIAQREPAEYTHRRRQSTGEASLRAFTNREQSLISVMSNGEQVGSDILKMLQLECPVTGTLLAARNT